MKKSLFVSILVVLIGAFFVSSARQPMISAMMIPW